MRAYCNSVACACCCFSAVLVCSAGSVYPLLRYQWEIRVSCHKSDHGQHIHCCQNVLGCLMHTARGYTPHALLPTLPDTPATLTVLPNTLDSSCKAKVKHLRRRSVGQAVLVSGHHLGTLHTWRFFLWSTPCTLQLQQVPTTLVCLGSSPAD
jgi:hypothetical protein